MADFGLPWGKEENDSFDHSPMPTLKGLQPGGGQVMPQSLAADHVHLLVARGRKVPRADLVKELKRGSTAGLRGQAPALAGFEWQAGYDAFSVSTSRLDGVVAYIAHQEEHHRAVTFKDELRAFFGNTRSHLMNAMCGIERSGFDPFRVVPSLCDGSQGSPAWRDNPGLTAWHAVGVQVSIATQLPGLRP